MALPLLLLPLLLLVTGEHPKEPNCTIPDVGSARPLWLVAGRPYLPGLEGDGRPSTLSKVRMPTAVTTDIRTNHLYVSDTGNHAVRSVNLTSGIIFTVAGVLGVMGSQGDGGVATAAHLCKPHGLAVDASNDRLYVADYCNHAVRSVDFGTGNIAVVAGTLGIEGDSDSLSDLPAKTARLRFPVGLALDAGGRKLYISDHGNHAVRILDLAAGVLSTLISGGSRILHYPRGLSLDMADDLLYVADSGSHTVMSIEVNSANVSLVAGMPGTAGSLGDDGGYDAGYALSALLKAPSDVAVDSLGRRLFIADSANPVVRVLDLRTTPNPARIAVARSGFYSGPGSADQIGPVGLALVPAVLPGFEVLWIKHSFDDKDYFGKYIYIDTRDIPGFTDTPQQVHSVRQYRNGIMIWNGHVRFINNLLFIGDGPGACPTCTAQALREPFDEQDTIDNFPAIDQWEIGDIVHITGMHQEATQYLYMAEAPNHIVRYVNIATPKPWVCLPGPHSDTA